MAAPLVQEVKQFLNFIGASRDGQCIAEVSGLRERGWGIAFGRVFFWSA
jgi:hypothetical protein